VKALFAILPVTFSKSALVDQTAYSPFTFPRYALSDLFGKGNGKFKLSPVVPIILQPSSYLAAVSATTSLPALTGTAYLGRSLPGTGNHTTNRSTALICQY
jgi:hypothetical protein